MTNYVSQPETLQFRGDGGRQRTYTPDFKVWRSNGQIELHEVTVEARRIARESLQQREAAAHAICRQRGWRYLVHTDQTLPSGHECANLDFLSAFRATINANAESTTWWLERLAGEGQVHPRTLLVRAGADRAVGTLLNGLYHMLWHGIIQMDWHQPFIWRGDFHPEACVWLPATPSNKAQSQFRTGDSGQKQEVRP